MARSIRKLVSGDAGFSDQVEKFEVIDPRPTRDKTRVLSVDECQARIDGLVAKKAEEAARWDERIAAAEQTKADLIAAG